MNGFRADTQAIVHCPVTIMTTTIKNFLLAFCIGLQLDDVASTKASFYRSLFTLTNESKAILPGEIESYKTGNLGNISCYVNIVRTDVDDEGCAFQNSNNVYLTERSSCPWKFVLNTDENRIPREIYEATCRSNSCLVTSNNDEKCLQAICEGCSQPGCNRCPQPECEGCQQHRCEEIHYFTWVKRRTGFRSFQKVLEPVSVGCTCVKVCPDPLRAVNENRTSMCI